MAILYCDQSDVIDRVVCCNRQHGHSSASLILSDKTDASQIEDLRKQLAKQHISTLVDYDGGHTVVEARGFKNHETLVKSLKQAGIPGEIRIEATPDDLKKGSMKDKIGGSSLLLSALFYDLGNIALGVSGIQRGRHNKDGKFTSNDISELMTGAAFSVGDLLMTAYGKNHGDEELKAAAEGLEKHLKSKGIKVPQGDALTADTLHQSGAMAEINHWLNQNISRIKCLTEMTGGLFMIHAGTKKGNFNLEKVIAGSLLTTAWASTFVLDKPRGHKIFDGSRNTVDGVKPPEPTLMEKIRANPRGWIAAPLSMSNNVFNLVGAGRERSRYRNEVAEAQKKLAASNTAENLAHLNYTQGKQHDYIWNIVTACSFLTANGLFGLSGKSRPMETEDDKRVMDDLVLMAANVLAKQPETVRQSAISDTAEYVSHLAHVSLGKEAIEKAITQKVSDLSHSSWARKTAQEASPSRAL